MSPPQDYAKLAPNSLKGFLSREAFTLRARRLRLPYFSELPVPPCIYLRLAPSSFATAPSASVLPPAGCPFFSSFPASFNALLVGGAIVSFLAFLRIVLSSSEMLRQLALLSNHPPTFIRAMGESKVSPLRYAPVEMTN